MLPNHIRIKSHSLESLYRSVETQGSLLLEKCPGYSFDDRLECAAFSIRDHGRPTGHGLDRYEPEVLLGREEERFGTPEELILLCLARSESPLYIRFRSSPERLVELVLSTRDDNEALPRGIECVDQEIEFLVGDDPSDGNVIILLLIYEGKLGRIHPRIDHGTLAIVVLGDPILRIDRVGDEKIGALCGRIVLLPQYIYQQREDDAGDRIQPAKFHHMEVFLIVAPVVAGRRVAVADVECAWLGDDPLALRGARGDHEIVSREVKCSESEKTQEWHYFRALVHKGELLDKARTDLATRKKRIPVLVEYRRENIRLRKDFE